MNALAQSVVKGAGALAGRESSLAGEGIGEEETRKSQSTASAGGFKNWQIVQNAEAGDQNGDSQTGTRSLNREKRVLLTPEEERLVERLVDRIGEQLGASLKLSHLLACVHRGAVSCRKRNSFAETRKRVPARCRVPPTATRWRWPSLSRRWPGFLSKALRDAPSNALNRLQPVFDFQIIQVNATRN